MSFQRAREVFKPLDNPLILSRMTRPSADVREAELLQKLSDIARMKVDAEPFGNDTLEIEAPPPDDAIFLTVLSESVHNWPPTASRSVHAMFSPRGRPAPARRDIFVGVPFLGGCGVLVVLTIVTGVVIVAEVRSAGQSQQHRRRDTD
jgi:hypothetical protein